MHFCIDVNSLNTSLKSLYCSGRHCFSLARTWCQRRLTMMTMTFEAGCSQNYFLQSLCKESLFLKSNKQQQTCCGCYLLFHMRARERNWKFLVVCFINILWHTVSVIRSGTVRETNWHSPAERQQGSLTNSPFGTRLQLLGCQLLSKEKW